MEWLGVAGLGLFGINRKGFMFDAEQQMKRAYQGQNMRIKQYELYREDVRDLVELTVAKMDNYLVIGTLQMIFVVRFFYEGQPLIEKEWPAWMVWFWAIGNSSAFLYFMQSMWLAMHASIAAHSFGVRMLTQFVRLPLPDRAELDATQARGTDYEAVRTVDMLRLPMLKQQLRRLNAAMSGDHAALPSEVPGSTGRRGSDDGSPYSWVSPATPQRIADLEHIRLYQEAQENWQAYDAYARICMGMGTNQLLSALSSYLLGLLIVEIESPTAAICCTVVLAAAALELLMLDVYNQDEKWILLAAGILIFAPLVLSIVGILAIQAGPGKLKLVGNCLVLCVFLVQAGWISFMAWMAKPLKDHQVAIPIRFRSVLYLDVFGWLASRRERRQGNARRNSLPQNLQASLCESCVQMGCKIHRDLLRWESQGVVNLSDGATSAEVQALREQFRTVARTLGGEESLSQPPQDSTAGSELPVWLRLELTTSGRRVDVFHDCASGQVRCAPPEGAARILDLETLKQQLEAWEQKASALVQDSQNPPCGPGGSGAGGGPGDAGPRDPGLLAHSNEAAMTFNYSRERQAPVESASGTGQRQPGTMPWKTFFHGSVVLIAIWLTGAIWHTYLLISDLDSRKPLPISAWTQNRRATRPSLGLEPEWVGRLPRPLGRPRSLACHAALGPRLLVAETYAVHELHPDAAGGQAEAWRPALVECLADAPDFAAGGIRGISVECPQQGQSNNHCAAVLLSVTGRRVLRCSINGTLPAVGGGGGLGGALQVQPRSAQLTMHGGPWWTVMSPTAGDGTLLALDGKALVQLGPRLGFDSEMVPRSVYPHGIPENVTQLQVLSNGVVLGFEPPRQLHAWSGLGRRLHSWSLPAGTRWSGMCSDGQTLHLAGMASDDGEAVVWKTRRLSDLDTL